MMISWIFVIIGIILFYGIEASEQNSSIRLIGAILIVAGVFYLLAKLPTKIKRR